MYERADREPPLPPLDGGEYLITDFHDAGMVSHTAEGPIPLTWAELRGFAGWADLTQDEASILRQMSLAYLDGQRIGREPLGRAPWGDD